MINTAIIGAGGYTGLELIKILINHPNFKLTHLYVSSKEQSLSSMHPSLEKLIDINVKIVDIDEINKNCQLVFLATPHTQSMQYVKQLDKNIKIVDLSADYRLDKNLYDKYYTKHIDEDNVKNATYGLPEFYRNKIKNTNLVANPGCYPTASLLGILPFAKYIDDNRDILIDAKSGVSGAGKTPNDIKHFVSVNNNMLVYNPLAHRHEPEIKEKISKIANKDININFVPTLIPTTRGMQCNIYLYIKEDINPLEVLKNHYKDEYFIRISDKPRGFNSVCGTNFCDIFATKKNNMIFISTNIDNLLRGASSQAVLNANIMFNIDENTAIPKISHMP